jgi:predicted DNA-binding transcriptional regulator AlpA
MRNDSASPIADLTPHATPPAQAVEQNTSEIQASGKAPDREATGAPRPTVAAVATASRGQDTLDRQPRHKRLRPWPRRMKVHDAADYCGESKSTFLRHVQEGLYPRAFKIGHNSYWYKEDLDDALDKQKEAAGPSSLDDKALAGEALEKLDDD